MDSYSLFVCVATAIALLTMMGLLIRFVRQVYYLAEEADARLIQIRDMLERMGAAPKPKKKRPPAESRPTPRQSA